MSYSVRASVWLSLTIVGGCLLAQDDTARIGGLVVDRATGQPLSKATLRLRAAGEPGTSGASAPTSAMAFTVVTGSDGKFAIEQIRPGRYTLTADHPGYARETYKVLRSTVLTVSPGPLADVRIALAPLGVIAGSVVDEEGSPVTEVQIAIWRYERSGGKRVLSGLGAPSPVDEEGRFRVANLPPGRYTVSATPRRIGGEDGAEGAATHVMTFYPNAILPVLAASITVDSGAMAVATIRLRKERSFRVQGKVLDEATGEPVTGFFLKLGIGSDQADIFTGAQEVHVSDGSFTFSGVLPGSYTIEQSSMVMRVKGSIIEAKSFGQYSIKVIDHDLVGLVVKFRSGATVRGTIASPRQDAPPASQKSVAAGASSTTVHLVAERTGVRGLSGHVADNGAFEIRNVAPEQYRVYVSGLPEGTYVKSVQMESQDLTNGVLDLTARGNAMLAIAASPKAGEVSGAVRGDNGDVAAGVLVTLAPSSIPPNAGALVFRQARTDENGQFTIRSLAPGDYRVWAWEEIDPNLATDPEFIASFLANAATVSLDENGRVSADLRMVSLETIKAQEARMR